MANIIGNQVIIQDSIVNEFKLLSINGVKMS
jgi:hypothetical protein